MPSRMCALARPARMREKVSSRNSRVICIFSSASFLIVVGSITISKIVSVAKIVKTFEWFLQMNQSTNLITVENPVQVAIFVHIKDHYGEVILLAEGGSSQVHHL